MTPQEQLDLLKLIRKNLVSVYCDVNHKFNDVDFADKIRTVIDQLDISIREFETDGTQAATQIAVQYMKGQPQASADKVCEFVKQVMTSIKSV